MARWQSRQVSAEQLAWLCSSMPDVMPSNSTISTTETITRQIGFRSGIVETEFRKLAPDMNKCIPNFWFLTVWDSNLELGESSRSLADAALANGIIPWGNQGSWFAVHNRVPPIALYGPTPKVKKAPNAPVSFDSIDVIPVTALLMRRSLPMARPRLER